jgi:lipopolysaccharide export system protein LptA
MRPGRHHTLSAAALAVLFAIGTPDARAQANSGPPNALQGFSQNRDKPVQIEAATLEVRDRDKVATFSGNVNVTQGDTNMRCRTLLVYYDQETGVTGSLKAAQPGPGGKQQIRRLEAKGDVVVTQKDQKATGDAGIFDMKTNTVTLIGNVLMTQGQNVLRGDKLVVDLTSGVSRVESGKSGMVKGLLWPQSTKDTKSDTGRKDTGKDNGKAAGHAVGAPKSLLRQSPIY